MGSLTRIIPGSAPVILVRLALVALAAIAVVAALVASRRDQTVAAHRYVCPMHSEITAAEPGDCPICGMALEEASPTGAPALARGSAGDPPSVALAALRSSAEAVSLLRFSVAPARRDVIPGEVYAPAVVEPDGSITAELYRDELASLAPDEAAELILAAAPATRIAIRRDAAAPIAPSTDDALARVSFRGAPGVAPPPPGQRTLPDHRSP